MTEIRVRLDVDVTIRVPHEVIVDVSEFDAWLAGSGYVGPSWATDLTEHHDQLIAFIENDEEHLHGMAYPDLHRHELVGTDITDVDTLRTTALAADEDDADGD